MPATWYDVQAKHHDKSVVWIYGDIGSGFFEETVEAKTLVKEIAAIDSGEIVVRISSYGGSVPDGIAIANAFEAHPAKITYQIDSVAYSMAAYIAAGSGQTDMASNALLMLHQPSGGVFGTAEEMREMAAVIDKWHTIYAQGIADKTGKNHSEIMALLADGKDHYFNADEAMAYGLIDNITEPVQVAASLFTEMEQRYKLPIGFNDMHPLQKEINALFAGHIGKTGVQALLTASLEDHTSTIDGIKAKLNALTATPAPVAAPVAAAPVITASEILAKEKARVGEIRAKFAPFSDNEGVTALLTECEDNTEMTVQAAGLKLLDTLGKDQVSAQTHSQFKVIDQTETIRAASVSAILCKAGKGTAEMRAEAATAGYSGHTLLDFAKASLTRSGVVHAHMNKKEIVAAAFTNSTSDFPILLENTMHKALLSGYAVASNTWRRFCAVGSVSDFRAHNRYMRGSVGNLLGKTELNEFKHGILSDGSKESITASTKGLIIGLSREMIVNDDLGAFVSVAADLGQSAARTIESDVYTALASNSGLGPLLSDGKTLFHADHSNIGSGAAISVAAIDADRVLMASQQDNGGNDFLDLRPSVGVVPIGLGGSMREVNAQEYNDDTSKNQRKPNVVRGLFSDVVDSPRITGTRRYLFADPSIAPVIEVAFLDGLQEPSIEMEQGFTVDGTSYKVALDYGVAGIGYQGAVTDAGA